MIATEFALLTPDEAQSLRPELVNIYRAAFGMPPHNETESQLMRFARALPDHIECAGFKICVGKNSERQIIGFAYGYTGQPGQWWYDSVARGLGEKRSAEWQSDCFEFMEFAVVPSAQGQGIGGRIHDILLQAVPNTNALLSTPRLETLALYLYRRRGWITLLDDFFFPGDTSPFVIMGKSIRLNTIPKS